MPDNNKPAKHEEFAGRVYIGNAQAGLSAWNKSVTHALTHTNDRVAEWVEEVWVFIEIKAHTSSYCLWTLISVINKMTVMNDHDTDIVNE